MKHRAAPKVSPYNDTKRKRLALLRKQDRERQALPLFAPLIAETQPDPEAVMQGYAKSWEQRQIVQREQRAAAWRAARRRLFAFPQPQRDQIRRSWSASPYPKDPASFADFLFRIETGKLSPGEQPWVTGAPVLYRHRRTPTSFAEAFTPLPTPAGYTASNPFQTLPITFIGNLGYGLLFLECRPGPSAPNILIKPLAEPRERLTITQLIARLAPDAHIETYQFCDPAKEAEYRAHRQKLKTMSDQAQRTTTETPNAHR